MMASSDYLLTWSHMTFFSVHLFLILCSYVPYWLTTDIRDRVIYLYQLILDYFIVDGVFLYFDIFIKCQMSAKVNLIKKKNNLITQFYSKS